MLVFNPNSAIFVRMALSIIRGFGISLLSLCLGFAFLSNDNLIVRLKSSPNKRVGSNRAQLTELTPSLYGSVDQEESKEKELSDDIVFHASVLYRQVNLRSYLSTSIELKNRTFILQDLYLSLPPPV